VGDPNVLRRPARDGAPGPDLIAKTWSSDPDDDAFIRAAYASGAQRLVSGDEDLLCLHHLNDLSILTPRAALEEIDRARRCHKRRCLRQ